VLQLQVVQGYAGWRVRNARLDFQPELPPFTGYVRLVGLHYAGATLTVYYNLTSMAIELLEDRGTGAVTLNCSGSKVAEQLREGYTASCRRSRFSLTRE
jgi:trehalose/maltose hydrolase-like predicted phosphorylase